MMKTQPKFEVYNIADISTKYITQRDGGLLSDKENSGHLASLDSERGDIYTVFLDEKTHEAQIQVLKRQGFSDAFLNIIEALYEKRIAYVRFDGDGGEIEGDFPTFDW